MPKLDNGNLKSMFGYNVDKCNESVGFDDSTHTYFDLKDGTLIGRIGISIRNIDGEDIRELGYLIRKEFRKKGYATEVCQATMKCAAEFPEIDKLYIVTHKDNEASEGLAIKLGFELVGESMGEKDKYKIFVKST